MSYFPYRVASPTPVFELVEAAFDAVPARVAVGVAARWAAAGRAAATGMGGLVGLLRDGAADARSAAAAG